MAGGNCGQQVVRGSIKGALVGVFLGLLPMVWLLYHFSAQPNIKAMAFSVPFATFTAGLIIGLLKAKRDCK